MRKYLSIPMLLTLIAVMVTLCACGSKPSTPTYELAFSTNDATLGTVTATTDQGEVASGSSLVPDTLVTMTAVAAEGCELQGWYVEDKKVGDATQYTFAMPSVDVSVRAQFARRRYVVAYRSADTAMGSVSGTVTTGSMVEHGTAVTMTATPNVGYTFVGWYEGTEVVTDNPYSVTVTQSRNIEARFRINRYAVTYAVVGNAMGSVSGSVQSGSMVEHGTRVTITATANAGYTFAGWYAGNDRVATDNPYSVTVTAATSLTARFDLNRYALVYGNDTPALGEVTGSVASASEVAFNESVTLTATPNTGCVFDGWFVGQEKVSDKAKYTFSMTADCTVKARFSKMRYPLVYAAANALGSVTGNVLSGSTVAHGTNVILSASCDQGYVFAGWYENNVAVSDDETYTFTMTAARTLEARFEYDRFALTYAAADGGGVTGSVSTGTDVAFGSSVTMTATPNAGYAFVAWYRGKNFASDANPYTFTMPATALELTAQFAIIKRTVTYTYDGAMGSVTGSVPGGAMVDYGTQVTLGATPNVGYHFVGWYAGGAQVSTNANYAFVMADVDVVLEARFAINQYTLTYAYDDVMGSVACASPSGSTLDYGTQVTLTATPSAGYHFVGWYAGGVSVGNANAYGVEMTVDVTIEARFAINKYTLTYATADVVKGSVSGSADSGATLDHGTWVTLTATPNEGYDFVGWYAGDALVSALDSYAFVMTGDMTLAARFVVQKRTVHCIDGDWSTDIVVDYSTTVPALPAREKANYSLVGWYEYRNGSKMFFDNRAITADITLYAEWEATVIYYEVRYVDWDGAVISVQQIEQGHGAINPANPTRTGYNFTGWSSEGNYAAVTGNVIVTANYTIKQYTVTFLWEKDGEVYDTRSVEHWGKVRRPITPLDGTAQKQFDEWYLVVEDGVDKVYNFDLTVDEALTLYATWTTMPPVTHTVRFLVDGVEVEKQVVTDGGAAVAPATPTKTGYKFVSWDVAFGNVITDLDVNAQFETAQQTVTFVYYDGATFHSEEQTVAYGADAVPPAQYQRTGYDCSGWDVAYTNITADIVVTAQYTIKTLTANYYRGNTDTLLATNTTTYGGTFAVPATPTVAGYSFINWYADEEMHTKFDFTKAVTADVSVYGLFEAIVQTSHSVVFLDWNGTEISAQTVVHGQAAIDPGDPTRTGWTFTSWSAAYDAITEDTVVTAQYAINRYVITYLAEDEITPLGEQTVDYGTDATALVTPPAITGKTFLRWSANISSVAKSQTVYAIYDANVLKVYFVEANDNKDRLYTQNVRYGDAASVPTTPTKQNYVFAGWYADEELTQVYNFNTAVTADGTYVYAKWEAASGVYTVYFKDYDGNSYGNAQRVVANQYVMEPDSPTKAGVEFDGWYIEGTDTRFDFDEDVITRSITLIARAKE